jgi:hypothetical protein
MSKVSA